jgi:tetratricopeptide (TPR) repeat protein
MMVKNEEHCIGRAIRSAFPYVDSVVIVDTGSTDNTYGNLCYLLDEEVGKPWLFCSQLWSDFGANRTSALQAAKAEMLRLDIEPENVLFLTLDADDEILSFPDKSEISATADCFTAVNKFGSLAYPQIRLLRGNVDFVWVGKTHEELRCTTHDAKVEALPGFEYKVGTDSSRRKSGNKTSEDIDLLIKAVEENTLDSRAWFYLGNSYLDLREYVQAISHFEARTQLQGFAEEIYLSWVRMGICYEAIGQDDDAILCWLKAIDLRPWRAEAYTHLAFRAAGNRAYNLAAMWARMGLAKSKQGTTDRLFVDTGCGKRCLDLLENLPSSTARFL